MRLSWLALFVSVVAIGLATFSLIETSSTKEWLSSVEPESQAVTAREPLLEDRVIPIAEKSRMASPSELNSSNISTTDNDRSAPSATARESVGAVDIGVPMDPDYLPYSSQPRDGLVDMGLPMQPEVP